MKLSPTLRKRFKANVKVVESGCHEWQLALSNGGYGMCSIAAGVSRGAHTVAWFLKYGHWPKKCLLHSCDNRRCCNVAHLSEGTHAENAADAKAKGRLRAGEQHGMSKLTDAQRAEMRALRAQGTPIKVLASRFGVCQSAVSYNTHL